VASALPRPPCAANCTAIANIEQRTPNAEPNLNTPASAERFGEVRRSLGEGGNREASTQKREPRVYVIGLQGVGSHLAAFASRRKWVLVMKSVLRKRGSVTIVVTTSHSSPFGAANRSKYSVIVAVSL